MRFGVGFVVAAMCAGLASPQTRQGLHKDEELGFQVEAPRGWKKVPIAAQEQWIVAKFVSNQELAAKKEGYVHTPEMKVILFPDEVVKGGGVDVKKEDEGNVSIRIRNPYRDYMAYLKQNSYGGYYVSGEETRTVNGIATRCLEIRFEKLTVPRRAYAWIYRGEDAEWAIHVEALEDWWERLAPEFTRSLRSFKFIPRTTPTLDRGARGDGGFEVLHQIRKTTPQVRALQRAELFDRELKTTLGRLPSDWIQRKSANFVALSHADERYTARLLDQAEAIVAWLGQNFAWIGDGLPGPAIVRICKDYDEYRAFADMSRDTWFRRSFEIATYKDVDEGRRSLGVQNLNQSLLELWFFDKNPRFGWGTPPWIRLGLSQFLMTAAARGGRLEFKPDEWERDLLRETSKKGGLASPRDLFLSTWDEIFKRENGWPQCGAFVHFLWTGPRASTTKELFKTYLKNTLAILEEEEKEEEAKRGKDESPRTEEEEEARFKARAQEAKKRLEAVFERTFGSWSDAQWATFEKSYFAFVD